MSKDLSHIIKRATEDFSMVQHTKEITGLLEFIQKKNLKSFIEIGTYKGGTLYTLASVCPGKKISIDFPNPAFGYSPEGSGYDTDARNKKFKKEFPDTEFIVADSHKKETFNQAKKLLGREKVDFLFIDGDHTYAGVKQDLEMYRPLLKKDGYIIFHDIIASEFHRKHECYVDLLWNELKGEKIEIIDGAGIWGGIGIIKNQTGEMLLRLSIFQPHFDQHSKACLDSGFIPYDNTNLVTLFFENDVLLDVFYNKKETWENADYVGVLSWRFKEKTGLTSADIMRYISSTPKKNVYSLTPADYENKFKNIFSEAGFGNIQEICKIIDKKNIFPFKLYKYNPYPYNTFCNFWLATPEIFADYIENYVVKMHDFLLNCNDPDFQKQVKIMIQHRGGLYPIHAFMMEGLFECYAHYKQYSFAKIQEKLIPDITPEVPIQSIANDIIFKPALHIVQHQKSFAHA